MPKRVTAPIVLTTLPDIDLQICNDGPLFDMTRTERVRCEFPTKDVDRNDRLLGLTAMHALPQDQRKRMHFVAQWSVVKRWTLSTRIINQE